MVTAIEVPYNNYPIAVVAGITPNKPPVAKLTGDSFGTIGLALNFDAGGSYDPDGHIVAYQWDWNNDWVFDEETQTPTASHIWTSEFSGYIYVKAIDNEAASSIIGWPVTIYRNKKISGGAYNYPQTTTYKASFSMDLTGPGSLSGWLKYYYSRTCLNFVSTGISSVSFSGNSATINGTGSVNGAEGYTFTASVVDGPFHRHFRQPSRSQ